MTRFQRLFSLIALVLALMTMQPSSSSATPPGEGIHQIGAWREGPVGAFACRSDSMVYLGTGVVLQTWNIADMDNPVMTSEIEYPKVVQALEFDGDWLIGVINGSLITLDISDPTQPLPVSSTEFDSAGDYKLCLGGDFVYVVDIDGELTSFDLTDPAAPILADSDWAPWGYINSMTYEYGVLYLGSLEEPLIFTYDVSDPYIMSFTSEELIDDIIKEDGLFVFDHIMHVFSHGSGWLKYDINNFEAGSLGQVSPNSIRAHQFHGGIMTTFEDGAYKVYDIMAGPMHVATIDPGLTQSVYSLRHFGAIILGKLSDGSLNIYNTVTDQQTTVEFPDVPDNGGIYENVYVTGSFSEHRLIFFDLTDPTDIQLMDSVDLPWTTNYLTVDNGYAVASCLDYGFIVIDLTTGPPFAVRDTIPTSGYTKATGFHGDLLYVTMSDNIIRSYDLSTPGAAVLVAEVLTTEYPRDLDFVDETMIFMASNKLQSYNLSNPNDPTLMWTLDTGSSLFQQISISGNMIYACALLTGIQVVELMPTGELKPIITYSEPPSTYGLRASDSRLYTAVGHDGVMVYDISNPLDLVPVYEETGIGYGHSVDMWNRKFVVLNDENGFTVYMDDMITPVSLTTLAASRIPGGASVSWNYHSEQHDEAFHVWRGDSEARRVRVTETPLSGVEQFSWTDPAPPASPTLYWLEEVSSDGTSTWYGPASLVEMELPQHAMMDKPWPNPFNPEVALRIVLPSPSQLTVTIHDLRGRRVATLFDGPRDAGAIVLSWQGRDDEGRPMHSGTYFAKMNSGDEQQVRKLMLVR